MTYTLFVPKDIVELLQNRFSAKVKSVEWYGTGSSIIQGYDGQWWDDSYRVELQIDNAKDIRDLLYLGLTSAKVN
jgi:hypothetical protein